jgi:hypothetical protein
MTPPQAITLVAVSMAAITAIIAVIQQLHIQSLNSEKKDLKQSLLTSHKNHANEREVTTKLEADLKQADEAYDLLVKESRQAELKRDKWQNKYLDTRLGLEREKVDRNVEVQHLTVKLNAANENLVHALKQAQQYHDIIAMPRRKRDKVIAELRAK